MTQEVVCVHYWGALTRFPGEDGWREQKVCLRCRTTWNYCDQSPEPETVIGLLRDKKS